MLLPSRLQPATPAAPRPRGFTLVELVVVVALITVAAGLAIPSAIKQLRDQKVTETATQLATLYRQARLKAMGRGSAVLVRFDEGVISVREARMGPRNAGCTAMPYPSCLGNDWNDTDEYVEVDRYAPGTGELAQLSVRLFGADGEEAVSALDLCFTPMGTTFARQSIDGSAPLTRLGSVYTAEVVSSGSARSRHVALLPNGIARLAAPPAP